jgi:N-acetylglucosamine kinase-like BadF-type ATPase
MPYALLLLLAACTGTPTDTDKDADTGGDTDTATPVDADADGSPVDERATNFAALFEKVDTALSKGDVQALAILTNAIADLAKSSPFKDLASIEATRRALKNPDHEWEL